MRSLQTIKKINDFIPVLTYAYLFFLRVEENIKYFLVGIISGLMVVFTMTLSQQLPSIDADPFGFMIGLIPLLIYNTILFILFILAIILFESITELFAGVYEKLSEY